MSTFRQTAADLWQKTTENPQTLKATIRELAPLASESELDRLTQLFSKAIHAPTKKERAAILREYRAELKKFTPAQEAQQPERNALELPQFTF